MKAICLYDHAGPEVLQYQDLPTPEPGPEQVLVRLKAAALNHLDLWVRKGLPKNRIEYPHIPGADGAGEVVEVGRCVKRWKSGDRIVINSNLGCGNLRPGETLLVIGASGGLNTACIQIAKMVGATGGRILTVGNTAAPVFETDNRYIIGKHLSILGSTMGTRRDFEDVMDLIFAGQLKPIVGHMFPLHEARAAQELLERGEQKGKITLEIRV